MSDKLRWPLFWALVAVFILIVCFFAIPAFYELLAGSLWLLSPFALFFVLGIALIIFSVWGNVSGWLKTFFVLTGASAAGGLVSVLLHNLIYGLFVDFWNSGDEFFFFITVLFVCLLCFLIGMVSTIIIGVRRRKASPQPPP